MTTSDHARRAEAVRSRVQALSDRQHALERHLADRLAVDHSGLMTMNLLVGRGPATPSELARDVGVSPAVMSLVLQRLERAGHIDRTAHPTDRRKVVVEATAPSHSAAMELVDPLISGIAEISDSLSDEQQATVERFLDALIALYERVSATDVLPGPAAD